MRFPVASAFAVVVHCICVLILLPAAARAQNNGAGGLDPTFHVTDNPLNYRISFLRPLPDGGVLAGGLSRISEIYGRPVTAPRLARFRADGSLVPAYGGNALAVNEQLKPLDVDAEGRLLALDPTTTPVRLHRLNPDGTLDAGFHDFPVPAGWSGFKVVAVQADGRILLLDSHENFDPAARPLARAHFLVALRGEDGTPAFVFPVPEDWESATRVVAQADGSVLVGGDFKQPFVGEPRLALLRLRRDGSLDENYRSKAAPGSGFGGVSGLFPTGNGQTIVENYVYPLDGATKGSTRLERRNADGSLAGGFELPESSRLYPLVYQPSTDGLISTHLVPVSPKKTNTLLVRLRASDGTLDDTFQPVDLNPYGGTLPAVEFLSVLPNGRLLLRTRDYYATGYQLRRLTPDGLPDATFQSAVNVSFYNGPAVSGDGAIDPVVVLPDGRLLVASYTSELFFYNGIEERTTVGLDRLLADPLTKAPDLAVSFPGILAVTRPDPAAPTVGKYKLTGPVRLQNLGNKSARDFSLTAYATARLDLYSPGQRFNAAADPTLRPLQLMATTDANSDLAALRARFDPAATTPAAVRVRKLAAGETRDVPLKLTYAADQEPGLKGLSLLLVVDAENRFLETDETNNARIYYALP